MILLVDLIFNFYTRIFTSRRSKNSKLMELIFNAYIKMSTFVDKIKVPVAISCSLVVGSFVYYMTESLQSSLCMTIVLACLALIFIADKYKGIAFLLGLIPCIPANRLYISNMDAGNSTSLLIRFIPLVGNGADLYRMFVSKTLEPSEGWNDQLFPLIK